MYKLVIIFLAFILVLTSYLKLTISLKNIVILIT